MDQDALLRTMVSAAESIEGLRVGVMLFVGGQAFSGQIISAREYGRRLNDEIAKLEGHTEIAASMARGAVQDSAGILHLRGERGVDWRIRLDRVDGFAFLGQSLDDGNE